MTNESFYYALNRAEVTAARLLTVAKRKPTEEQVVESDTMQSLNLISIKVRD